MEVGERILVGYSYDLSKARKATLVGFETPPSMNYRIKRPIIRIDGEQDTITLPGNAFEVTFNSLLILGPVKDEG